MHSMIAFGFLALSALFNISRADTIRPLPMNASPGAIKFQPALDFDKDACYQTAAFDSSGKANPGLPLNGDYSQCRSPARLELSNTYVRQRCNHDWCVYMYGYYFEKDPDRKGHTHDWEHVIVWTLKEQVRWVSWSAHGKYITTYPGDISLLDGTHPKIVYHKGKGRTHSFRKAKGGEKPENYTGQWFLAPLVSVEMMAKFPLRWTFMNFEWEHGHVDLKNPKFADVLWAEAMRSDMRDENRDEGFDPLADEYAYLWQ